MKLAIRPARAEDTDALRRIFRITRASTFDWKPPGGFRDRDFDRETAGELVLAALADDTPVGFVSLWEADNFIHHLFVLPDFQNRGVGTALHAAALRRLRQPARLKCLARNGRALEFYRRRGWTTVGRGKDDGGDDYELMEFAGFSP